MRGCCCRCCWCWCCLCCWLICYWCSCYCSRSCSSCCSHHCSCGCACSCSCYCCGFFFFRSPSHSPVKPAIQQPSNLHQQVTDLKKRLKQKTEESEDRLETGCFQAVGVFGFAKGFIGLRVTEVVGGRRVTIRGLGSWGLAVWNQDFGARCCWLIPVLFSSGYQ